MKRLLLYVHFNKYGQLSQHVVYQLEQLRPLFERVVFISNSPFSEEHQTDLQEKGLLDSFIQRENKGYDFAAWHDGMDQVGFDQLKSYDSVTVMNDTCFGPLWDLQPYYDKYEGDQSIDFWGMTNHQGIKAGNTYIDEHLQSYFISFKQGIIQSDVFQNFWQSVETYTDVQDVIDNYETKYTKLMVEAGFNYASVLNTLPLNQDFFHSNFTIHYPHVLLDYKVPFIKVKTFDLTQHLSPFTLQAIEQVSDYPLDLITSHMSQVSEPTPAYLLDRKVLPLSAGHYQGDKKIAVHLHTFYLDLLVPFLRAFEQFHFAYDLFLTTDSEEKKAEIEAILAEEKKLAKVYVTGKKGRDVLPMLKLKEELVQYDYIGHFHTKKSPEYPYWVGDSWREELLTMLVTNADTILTKFDQREDLGMAIADIPSFFRYTKIVDPWNENRFASDMNELWQRLNLDRKLDFDQMNTFIMSYGTFIWFKYDALSPLFDLNLTDEDVPAEPLPQHTILHAIERILIYIAWAKGYDYLISQSPIAISAFVDNRVLNIRPDTMPNTYVNFNNIGGIKGALKYIFLGPASAIKYILKRGLLKIKS